MDQLFFLEMNFLMQSQLNNFLFLNNDLFEKCYISKKKIDINETFIKGSKKR